MIHKPNRTNACPDYIDALVDISDNELPADERNAIANHVASCPGCRAELARLDASLVCLVNSISTASVELPPRTASPSPLRWAAAVAAIGLICIVSARWIGQRPLNDSRPNNVAQFPRVPATSPAPKLSQHDALWQIALIEQQARLQTSLDLMPTDAWYGEQREANQHIVDKLREVAARGERNL
jgi:anti-sigma factor RsiW